MTLEIILRSKASTYFNTSITVLTDDLLLQYMKNFINSNYPNLSANPLLYEQLCQLTSLDNIDLYQWWFGTPIGPNSCSRDIGDLRALLSAGKGDEWSNDLEEAVRDFQIASLNIPVTGYACNETIRRLRL